MIDMEVVIYGASSGGRKALEVCDYYDIKVIAFVDREKTGTCNNVPIKSLDDEGINLLKNNLVIMGTEYKDAENYVEGITKGYIPYSIIDRLYRESVNPINIADNIDNVELSNNIKKARIKNALILGVTTNEGFQLAKLLMRNGYNVYCVLTEENMHYDYINEIKDNINIIFINEINAYELRKSMDISNPDEVYYFDGKMFSDVGKGENYFKNYLVEILEIIRKSKKHIKFCEGFIPEVFGNVEEIPQDEYTRFNHDNVNNFPSIFDYWNIRNYRQDFQLFACSCIIYENESELEKRNSILYELIDKIIKVNFGINEFLEIEDLDYAFDIGYTGDYVNAMWRMLQGNVPDDYVIATNESRTLREIIELAFSFLGMNIYWEKDDVGENGIDRVTKKIIIRSNSNSIKNQRCLRANPKKAIKDLKWKRTVSLEELIEKIIKNKVKSYDSKLGRKKTIEEQYKVESHTMNRLKSCICSQKQLESEAFKKICLELHLDTSLKYRKSWEFAYIIKALEERDMLKDGRKGVGFAVGEEPLSAYFASKGCNILATDLGMNDEQATAWAVSGQNAGGNINLLNKEGLCNNEIFEKNVRYRDVDMNNIPQDLENYDFCWSACAIEHVGGLEKSKQFLKNMLRVLKPGGIAVHTTEYNLSSNDDTITDGYSVIYRRKDIEEIVDWLRKRGHIVEVDFNRGRMEGDLFTDQQPYFRINNKYHLRLELGGFNSTSFGLIIQKKSENV